MRLRSAQIFQNNSSSIETLCRLSKGLRQLRGALVIIHSKISATLPIEGTRKLSTSAIADNLNQFDPVFLGVSVVVDEFDNFLDEALCQLFKSCARSLRTTLETAVWVAEFATERVRAKEIIRDLQMGMLTDDTLTVLLPQPALFERFNFQDRFGLRPPFGRLVEKTNRTLRSLPVKEINSLYAELSKYAHFSGQAYELNFVRGMPNLSGQSVESQLSDISFGKFYSYALDVLDCAFVLLMKAEAYYLDITPNKLARMISQLPPKSGIISEIRATRAKAMKFGNTWIFAHSAKITK